MVDPIKKILLKHPSNAFLNQRNINKQYLELNYLAAPNFNSAIDCYDSTEYQEAHDILEKYAKRHHQIVEGD